MKRVPLYTAIVLFGAFAIIAQVVFLREFLVVVSGNELFLGVIFSSWFVGIAVGALIAARLTDRFKEPLLWLVFLLGLQTMIMPVGCFFIRSLRLTLGVPPGHYIPFLPFLVGALTHIAPFSFITGLAFPIFCKFLERKGIAGEQGIGITYYVESLGSILGGVGFTFLLVTLLSSFQLAFFMGLLVILNLAWLWWQERPASGGLAKVFLVALAFFYLIILVSPLVQLIENRSIARRWQAIGQGMELIKTIDTKYQNLTLSYQAGQYSLATNGEFIAAFPDDYVAALKANFALTESREQKRILILGGGEPELIKYMLQWQPERIDYVELDARLIPFIKPYLREEIKASLSEPALRIHYQDGRYFVRQRGREIKAEEKYDVILLSLPEPTTAALNRFYTIEFFQDLRRLLKDEGLVATSMSSTVNYFGPAVVYYLGSVYKSLKLVFPDVVVTPGTTAYLFASPESGVITEDINELIKRHQDNGIKTPYFSPYIFYTLMQPSQLQLVKEALRASLPRLRINTDLNPVTYFYNLALWARFSSLKGSGSEWFFSLVSKLTLELICFIILGFLLLRLLYLWLSLRVSGQRTEDKEQKARRALRLNALYLITATGFMAMASEIIILYLFQNIFGYIYQKVGLIVALFMGGLAGGSYMLTRRLPQQLVTTIRALIFLEIAILGFIMGMAVIVPAVVGAEPGLFGWRGMELLFYLLTFISGFLAGAEFPLVGRLLLFLPTTHNSPLTTHHSELGYASGLLDSADHIGAMLGAFVTGVILVPALGIINSIICLAIIKGAGLVLLILSSATLGRLRRRAVSH